MKINSQNVDMLRQACELFMGKKENEIRNIALETMVSAKVTFYLFLVKVLHPFKLGMHAIKCMHGCM